MKSRAEKIKELEDQIQELKRDDVWCNLCGESCSLSSGPNNAEFQLHGLIDHVIYGGYSSTPGNGHGALDDGNKYKFSLCEFCLDWLFVKFTIPVLVSNYINGNENSWEPASERVQKDDWRKMKKEFFEEFEKRNLARSKK